MGSYGLMHSSATVNFGKRKDLLSALTELSNVDSDFNGENSEDHVSGEAKEAGYESDQDYLLERVKEIKDDEECVNFFLHQWLDNDGYYYRWEHSLLKNQEEKIIKGCRWFSIMRRRSSCKKLIS